MLCQIKQQNMYILNDDKVERAQVCAKCSSLVSWKGLYAQFYLLSINTQRMDVSRLRLSTLRES